MNLKLQLQYLFNYFGLDIKSYNLKNNFNFRLKHFLDYKEIDCVIDIGANDGQFGKNLRKIGYKGQIISFEPIVSAYIDLEDTSKKDKKWKVFNFALGENIEETEINISQNSLSSSILDMKKEHLNSAPTSRYVKREKISVKTLDSFKEEVVVHKEQEDVLELSALVVSAGSNVNASLFVSELNPYVSGTYASHIKEDSFVSLSHNDLLQLTNDQDKEQQRRLNKIRATFK